MNALKQSIKRYSSLCVVLFIGLRTMFSFIGQQGVYSSSSASCHLHYQCTYNLCSSLAQANCEWRGVANYSCHNCGLGGFEWFSVWCPEVQCDGLTNCSGETGGDDGGVVQVFCAPQ